MYPNTWNVPEHIRLVSDSLATLASFAIFCCLGLLSALDSLSLMVRSNSAAQKEKDRQNKNKSYHKSVAEV